MSDCRDFTNPGGSQSPAGVDLLGQAGKQFTSFNQQNFDARTEATKQILANRGGGRRDQAN